jgi:replicative DNA helicase
MTSLAEKLAYIKSRGIENLSQTALEAIVSQRDSYPPDIFNRAVDLLANLPEKAEKASSDEQAITIFSGKEALKEKLKLEQAWGNGLSTGFSEIDDYFTFLPEQLYLVSSPTHVGKTTLTLNFASRVASLGEPVLFASLEQGVFIADRVEAIVGGMYPEKLSLLTSTTLISVAKLIKAVDSLLERPRLVVVDHLHFMEKPQGKGATEAIDEMIISLQNAAKQMQLPILVVAHTRKLNTDKAAEMDDLRDSSSLSQVPSVVMLLHRRKLNSQQISYEKSYLSREGRLLIAKNRIGGKTGLIPFRLDDNGQFTFNPPVNF